MHVTHFPVSNTSSSHFHVDLLISFFVGEGAEVDTAGSLFHPLEWVGIHSLTRQPGATNQPPRVLLFFYLEEEEEVTKKTEVNSALLKQL